MDSSHGIAGDFPFPLLLIAAVLTAICCIFAFFSFGFSLRTSNTVKRDGRSRTSVKRNCGCSCACSRSKNIVATSFTRLNGSIGEMLEAASLVPEQQSGASMMEQLVPEITTHALSYLDYPSLCRLSMTNSLMRKAANDDSAWKALYHKDFTVEQDSIKPANGWKAYYAVTRAVVNLNIDFFNSIRDRSLISMGRIWLNADYIKCIHASGEFLSGFTAVMDGWRLAFHWEHGADFQISDVRTRVLSEMAWVTMKAYADMENGPFNITNVFEFNCGRWYMVHHHSSLMIVDADLLIV